MGISDSQRIKEFQGYCDEEYDLTVDRYQILEFFFRQLFMEIGYEYDLEDKHNEVFDPSMPPEQKCKYAIAHISEWQQKTGKQYGYEGVAVDEMQEHSAFILDYNVLVEQLHRSVDLRTKVLPNDIKESWIKELQRNLKDLLKFNDSQGHGYIKFSKGGSATVNEFKFDYFSWYIYLANAVYGEALRLQERHLGKRFKINEFLSIKIIREHERIDGIKKLTPERIKDRLKSGSKAKDEMKRANRCGLISSELLEYILTFDIGEFKQRKF